MQYPGEPAGPHSPAGECAPRELPCRLEVAQRTHIHSLVFGIHRSLSTFFDSFLKGMGLRHLVAFTEAIPFTRGRIWGQNKGLVDLGF